MKKIVAIFLFALVGVAASLQAQTKQYYSLGWDIALPTGDYSNFISDASLRGGSFSGNVFVTDAVSIGFRFGYNSFHENKDKAVYQIGDGQALTAATYNYMVNAPVVVGPYYHFNLGSVEPYVGLGLGVNYITQETLIQDIDIYKNEWAFIMNPEIGLRFPFKNVPLAAYVKVGYNVNFNSYNALGNEYNNLQTINFGIGLSWTVQ